MPKYSLERLQQTVKKTQIIHNSSLERIEAIAPTYKDLSGKKKIAEDALREAYQDYDEAKETDLLVFENARKVEAKKEELKQADEAVNPIGEELDAWLDQIPKRTVIFLYSAFEVFLRQRLVEHIMFYTDTCFTIAQERNYGLFRVLQANNLQIEETVISIIDGQCKSFHTFWEKPVKKLYESLTGITPCSTDFSDDNLPQNEVIKTYDALVDTIIDLRLLHAMRNHFAHGFSQTSKRYEDTLNSIEYELNMQGNQSRQKKKGKDCYEHRLPGNVQKNYFGKATHPPPMDILMWDRNNIKKEIEKEPGKIKEVETSFQQFYDSVMRFAGYIDSIIKL